MELATLQFQTAIDLWNFRLEIAVNVFEMNLKHKTLICKCNEQQVKIAIEKYRCKTGQ
jgi:hypothetical protein